MFLRRRVSERGWGASPFAPPNPLATMETMKQRIKAYYLTSGIEEQNREDAKDILIEIENFEVAFAQGDVAAVGDLAIQIGARYGR
jgi:hypothetical protein